MKRMIAFLLIAVLICGMMATVAMAASNEVISPESGNTTVPEKEPSPQTGESFPIGLIAVAAVLLLGTAAVTLKKTASC